MRSRLAFVKVMMVVSAMCASAFALDEWRIGLKAGANLSSLWGQGVDDFESELSGTDIDGRVLWNFNGSVFATFVFVQDFFAIQPEIMYRRTGKGWDANFTGAPDQSFALYTDYLTIPVLAKFSLPIDFFLTPFAYAGPELAIAVRARTVDVAGIPTTADAGFLESFGTDEDILGDVNNPDFGLVLGLGANMDMGPGQLEFDVRYNFGFLDVYDVPGADDIRNSSLALLLGYSLAF